jgi:uncharacterized protein
MTSVGKGRDLAGAVILAVMAKAPLVGTVKTRLAGTLGAAAATDLYARFLADTLAVARSVDGVRVRVVCPDDDHCRALREIVHPDVGVEAQAAPGLMAGLAWALSSHLRRGAAKVLLIDADSPTLPASILGDAIGALDRADLCVGPCPDGGYYLIGARRECPGLFDGVVASAASTLDQTLDRARRQGMTTAVLAPWPDVDTPEDFAALVAFLRPRRDVAAASRGWLVANGWLEA